MKRLGSTDSICPSTEQVYSKEFQSMLEGLDEEGYAEKKRRLSVDQVKALEKNFEVENKLEPDRKVKLAEELGLQPRQVAVWFQNRRARWKTKQLEHDYSVLKANYDSLKLNFDKLQHDNEALLKEINEIKSKLLSDDDVTVKDEIMDGEKNEELAGDLEMTGVMNGSSDSDTSAILNDEQNLMMPLALYQPQFVKIEEYNFIGGDGCNFFSDEQAAPSLHHQWYSNEDWN